MDEKQALADAQSLKSNAYWVEVGDLDDSQYRVVIFQSALRQDWPDNKLNANLADNIQKALIDRFGRVDSISYHHSYEHAAEIQERELMSTAYNFSVLRNNPNGTPRDPQILANEIMELIDKQFPPQVKTTSLP